MSAVLLDTHAFLWFVFADPRLTEYAARVVEDPDSTKLLSVVSIWEIVIKNQLGKLSLGVPIEDFVDRYIAGAELELVGIELPHLLAYARLPLHHRDPFDRLLVAQADALSVPILTADAAFGGYDVETLWRDPRETR